MTRAGRSGSHRSKKKRLTLALAPVAALAVAVPLMANAGAATPSEVDADCKSDSDRLENCEFVPVQHNSNNFGPNQRVSKPDLNCGSEDKQSKSFAVSSKVQRVVQLENGSVVAGGAKLANSVFEVGIQFNTQEINIKRDDAESSFSFGIKGTMKPDHIAFFMWSQKRTDVSGHLKATYKEEQDGQKVFFSPSKGSTAVHVFYPQLLKNGTPNGEIWLRNVKCGTPEADKILKDAGILDAKSEDSIRAESEENIRTEPGFGEGGENVIDEKFPLSVIPAL
ncbi:hypothetical protein ACQEVY_03175 [Streptomyces sp. CA-288835]|uniref:hypothetical protein n=1 Tax=Streptomyces sp. CA-288835 TaxID=3240069 RepID=UPI003D92D7F0